MKKTLLTTLLILVGAAKAFAATDAFSDASYFNWKSLRLADAVKEVRGDGSRVFAVFTEPACGYCRKYEKTLSQLKNVTIYRFLIPLDTGNLSRSIDIWCAGTSNEARLEKLVAAMKESAPFFKNTSCKNPIEQNVQFARKYDIYMTPTTIGSDGRLVQGYLPLPNLERWLSGKGAFDK